MSSLYILATGTLIADPQRREGTKGLFATGAIRVEAGEPTIISVIAFGDTAGRLPELAKGDAIAVSGRAQVKSWADREGVTQRGLSVVVEQIAAAKPRPRSETLRDAGRPNLENPNKTHGRRHKYPRHPLARDPVPELPSDSVADLYADIVP